MQWYSTIQGDRRLDLEIAFLLLCFEPHSSLAVFSSSLGVDTMYFAIAVFHTGCSALRQSRVVPAWTCW